jgi:DHA1 family tetracycline resistance protein-like MFS transporter
MKRSPLTIIFITIFIDLVGFGMIIPLLPLYAEGTRFNATSSQIGWLVAAYSIMQLIFSPILGGLSDKYGRKPILFFSLIGTSIGFLILGLANTLWMLFTGRILDGITGGNISTAQAYIADVTTPEERAKGMGLVGAAFGLGFVFGPFIGGVLSGWGISVPFFFAAALTFVNAIMLIFLLPETVTKDHPARNTAGESFLSRLSQALKNPQLSLVLLMNFLLNTAFSIMTTVFALFTQYRFGYDAQYNGYLFFFIGVIAVITQGGLFGKLANIFGEKNLLIVGSLMLVFSLAVLPFVYPQTFGLIGLLVNLFFLSVGNSLIVPSISSLASKSASAREQGIALGASQSAASLARAVGPVIGGWLLYHFAAPQNISDYSVIVTFWVSAGIIFLAAIVAVYFSRKRVSDYAQLESSELRL